MVLHLVELFPLKLKKNKKNSITGKTHSEESKLKMSESRQGEKHWNYGKTTSTETKNKISETTKITMDKYKGLNNPMHTHNIDFKGSKNPNYGNFWSSDQKLSLSLKKSGSNSSTAKKINIYNPKNELMFTSHGNFKKTCFENNLPFSYLRTSYQNGGTKILKGEYSNWYAKIQLN